MKVKKKKNIAVLFSSGLDSTYLVYKNLKEGHNVHPYYIDIKNNENKRIVELQNVKELTRLFMSEFTNMYHTNTITEITLNIEWNCDLIFTQLPLWVFSLSYISTSDYDEIQIGYVCNDDAISYLDDIRKYYKAHQWLHKKKLPKLLFPLTKSVKYEMMDALPEKYKTYVTSCENPILKPYFFKTPTSRLQYFEPCRTCVACQRIIRENLGYNYQYRNMVYSHYTKLEEQSLFNQFKERHPKEYDYLKKHIDDTYARESMNKYEPLIVGNDSYGGDEKASC